jgi:hypothetical protein
MTHPKWCYVSKRLRDSGVSVSGLVYSSIKVAIGINISRCSNYCRPHRDLRATLLLLVLTIHYKSKLTKSTMGETAVNGATNGAPVKKQLILNAFVESCESNLHFKYASANIVQVADISLPVSGDIQTINLQASTRFNIGSSSLNCWKRANFTASSLQMFW